MSYIYKTYNWFVIYLHRGVQVRPTPGMHLIEPQLIFRAGLSSHKTVREGRLVAFASVSIVQGGELVLNDEPSPGIHFVSPAPRRDRRVVGRT